METKKTDQELFSFVEFDHAQAERTGYSEYSYWKSVLRTFAKNKFAMFLVFLVVGLCIFAFFANANAKIPFDEIHRSDRLSSPNLTYLFGTDAIGRDMWARTWYGTTISIKVAATTTFFCVSIGVIIGCIWGYVRATDRFFTELYNILANVPQTIYLILLTYIMERGFWTLVFAMCVTGWLTMARNVRNLVFMIRDREYNLASRCLGTPTHKIILHNILPYLVSVIVTSVSRDVPNFISYEVFLGYVGVGLTQEEASLGRVVQEHAQYMQSAPYLFVIPVFITALISVSL